MVMLETTARRLLRSAYNPAVTNPPPDSGTAEPAPYWHVSAERYCAMLPRLAQLAAALPLKPDAVVGIKRSGLFPAVYLSHALKLPMLTDGEAKIFPYPKLQYPVVVDVTVWTGKSLRRTLARLRRAGVPAEHLQSLVAWVGADSPPIPDLHFLDTTDRIMHFWYEEEEQSCQLPPDP